MFDAIIVSDFHLGSDNCQAKLLEEFLATIQTKKLILNGDIFDNLDFRRLKKHHWHVLSKIRKMSDHVEIIFATGNHDGPAEILSHLLGVEVKKEYGFVSGGNKILCLHGDKFDKFIIEKPILTWIGDTIYYILQKMDKTHTWARIAKHSSKEFLRNAQVIQREAVHYAHKRGYDIVCCGHTHAAIEAGNYFNSGSWTELPCSYLSVLDGAVKVNYCYKALIGN